MTPRKVDFIGTGWAFRFPRGAESDGMGGPHTDARGRVALAVGAEDIEQAIRLILLTSKGERVMRPEFGCQIHELVFASNDSTTAGRAAYYVEEALAMWEPRITVLRVEAAPDERVDGRLLVTIDYEIKATYDRRSLVFPFYRIPGE
jgi:phage baseplate assembly protein W